MIVERPIGTLLDADYSSLEVDYVDLEWYECRRRVQKATSHSGVAVGLRLDQDTLNVGLLQDDVLAVVDGKAIAVNVKEAEVLVVKLTNVKDAAKITYEIGNRHAPLFYGENFDEIMMAYDKPMEVMLEKLHAHPTVEQRKLLNNLSLSAVNTGAEGHSHSHGTEGAKIHDNLHKDDHGHHHHD